MEKGNTNVIDEVLIRPYQLKCIHRESEFNVHFEKENLHLLKEGGSEFSVHLEKKYHLLIEPNISNVNIWWGKKNKGIVCFYTLLNFGVAFVSESLWNYQIW